MRKLLRMCHLKFLLNLEETVVQRKEELTGNDTPEPSLQNTHSCVLVSSNIAREHLKS